MRIKHALGVAGGTGGVAQAGGSVLIKRCPGKICIRCSQPGFIGVCIGQAGFRHMRFIGQDDVLLDAGDLGGDGLNQGTKVRSTNSILSSA